MRTRYNLISILGYLFFFAISLLVFYIGRVALGLDVLDGSELSSSEFGAMLLYGARFDIMGVAYLLLPLVLLMYIYLLASIFIKSEGALWSSYRLIYRLYLALALIIVVAMAIVSFYYYEAYATKIDIFIFGLATDDTSTIMGIVARDYPLASTTILALACGALCFSLAGRLFCAPAIKSPKSALYKALLCAFNLGFIALYIIALRGLSLSTFPLKEDAATISAKTLKLNEILPNPLLALKWAATHYAEDMGFKKVDTRLEASLVKRALGDRGLYTRLDKNAYLATHRPNVVLNLMESFGGNLLAYDDAKSFDVLGRLRPHLAQDFVYHRFVSGGNGTAPSVGLLYFNSVVANLPLSKKKYVVQKNSPFFTYKKAGYRTIYVTSGLASWQDLGSYLKRQGIDEVYDYLYMIDKWPEAREGLTGYGVRDSYMYKVIEELLLERERALSKEGGKAGGKENDKEGGKAGDKENSKDTRPLFIITLSTSNHPPELVPKDYKPYPFKVTPKISALFGIKDIKRLGLVIKTYQYSNSVFGEFLDFIKANAHLRDSTLVAATGDHRLRSMYASPSVVSTYSVPLYLYIPEVIASHTSAHYDASVAGSHKDIIPTLISHSLQDTTFYSIGGVDLLDPKNRDNFGYNNALYITRDLATPINNAKASASSYAFDGLVSVQKTPIKTPPSLRDRIDAYIELLRYALDKNIMGGY